MRVFRSAREAAASDARDDEAWATRERVDLDDVPDAVIAKDLLLRNERGLGRAKDFADLEVLEEIEELEER